MFVEVLPARKVHADPELVDELRYLSFPLGSMRYYLDIKQPGTIFLAKDDREVLGWAYLTKKLCSTSYEVHVFVRHRCRGQGIGEKLLTEAKNLAKKRRKSISGRPGKEAIPLFNRVGIRVGKP